MLTFCPTLTTLPEGMMRAAIAACTILLLQLVASVRQGDALADLFRSGLIVIVLSRGKMTRMTAG